MNEQYNEYGDVVGCMCSDGKCSFCKYFLKAAYNHLEKYLAGLQLITIYQGKHGFYFGRPLNLSKTQALEILIDSILEVKTNEDR